MVAGVLPAQGIPTLAVLRNHYMSPCRNHTKIHIMHFSMVLGDTDTQQTDHYFKWRNDPP
jgi:hypothetical protein